MVDLFKILINKAIDVDAGILTEISFLAKASAQAGLGNPEAASVLRKAPEMNTYLISAAGDY